MCWRVTQTSCDKRVPPQRIAAALIEPEVLDHAALVLPIEGGEACQVKGMSNAKGAPSATPVFDANFVIQVNDGVTPRSENINAALAFAAGKNKKG